MDHHFFMREALKEAERAYALGEVPVGAVVVDPGGRIVARAANLREKEKDPTAHAEILALRQAAQVVGDWRLEGYTIYVTLEPCPMCAGAILEARIWRLVFGTLDPLKGAAGTVIHLFSHPALGFRGEVLGGILEGECSELLKKFFRELRRDG